MEQMMRWIVGNTVVLVIVLSISGFVTSNLSIHSTDDFALRYSEWSARCHQNWFCPVAQYVAKRFVRVEKRNGLATNDLRYDCTL